MKQPVPVLPVVWEGEGGRGREGRRKGGRRKGGRRRDEECKRRMKMHAEIPRDFQFIPRVISIKYLTSNYN